MAVGDVYLLGRSEEFYLAPGREASVNLALEKAPPLPCTKLYGRVTSGCGAIPGAAVKILDKKFRPLYHTDTDGGGGFSFVDTLAPGEYEIIAAADGYLVSESRPISLPPLAPLFITMRLVPDRDAGRGTVCGTVRDEENVPLPGARVSVYEYDDRGLPKAVTVTNRDGEYLVYGLDPGKYAVTAFLHGYILPSGVTVEIYPKEIACADIYLYRGKAALKGTVGGRIVHNGTAVPYAVAALYRMEGGGCGPLEIQRTNSGGYYLFSGLGPGKYVVKAKLEAEYPALCYNYTVE